MKKTYVKTLSKIHMNQKALFFLLITHRFMSSCDRAGIAAHVNLGTRSGSFVSFTFRPLYLRRKKPH